jgi:hypothetical protein
MMELSKDGVPICNKGAVSGLFWSISLASHLNSYMADDGILWT